jgi:hypothetical protein
LKLRAFDKPSIILDSGGDGSLLPARCALRSENDESGSVSPHPAWAVVGSAVTRVKSVASLMRLPVRPTPSRSAKVWWLQIVEFERAAVSAVGV